MTYAVAITFYLIKKKKSYSKI